MEIELEYADGTKRAERIIPVDLVAFERHFKMGWDVVKASPKVEHSLFLAWNSAKRCGHTQDSFDDWMATVVDLVDDGEEAGDGEDGDPLQP